MVELTSTLPDPESMAQFFPMNPMDKLSAEEWVNSASEKEIANVIFEYGEEKMASKILFIH